VRNYARGITRGKGKVSTSTKGKEVHKIRNFNGILTCDFIDMVKMEILPR